MQDLTRILDTYGSAAARWPVAVRQGALDLIAHNSGAAALFAEAKALDAVLAEAPRAPVSKALEDSILAGFEAKRASARRSVLAFLWPNGPAWVPASAFAASLMLGVLCASMVPAALGTGADGLTEQALANLFGLPGDEGLAPPSGEL